MGPSTKLLKLGTSTVKWGYYDLTTPFVAHVRSGDLITVEVATHTAGNDYAKMIKGDPAMEAIYKWSAGKTALTKSVPRPPGSGSHIVTGPINVCGAMPGDVIQVEIKKMIPRKNPVNKKTYGSNVLTNFGYHYTKGGKRDGSNFTGDASTVTIYEIAYDRSLKGYYGLPVYQYKQPPLLDPSGSGVATTKTTAPIGYITPHAIDVAATGLPVTYPEGFQFLLANGVTNITYTNASLAYQIPLRPHLGIMAVMPADGQNFLNGGPVGSLGASTVSPSVFGGNIDNWRISAGTTMYYRAELPGARLVVSDTHAAQGDSELSGTAIETSFTVMLRIRLLSQARLPDTVKMLNFPLGETRSEYMIHGFAYSDYLSELASPITIGTAGGSLDMAFKGAYDKTRNFLIDAFHLQEEEAIGVMSTSVDFIVTQVVDNNWGVHGLVKKAAFKRRTIGRRLLEHLEAGNLVEHITVRHMGEKKRKRREEFIKRVFRIPG